jgi:hypothetical protein
MAKKAEPHDEWINARDAAEILTEKSEKGQIVTADYVRWLGNNGKVETKKIDERTKVYSRADVESYQVRKRGDGSVRRAIRVRRTPRPDASEQAKEEAIA